MTGEFTVARAAGAGPREEGRHESSMTEEWLLNVNSFFSPFDTEGVLLNLDSFHYFPVPRGR